MSLITEIKEKQLFARQRKLPEASLYTTLLGEAVAVGKNAGNRETTDTEVVAVVKKFIKGIDETLEAIIKQKNDANQNFLSEQCSNLMNERDLLEQFLPKQLSAADLDLLIVGKESMPEFMKFLKENYAGQYDGKLASAVAKEYFSG